MKVCYLTYWRNSIFSSIKSFPFSQSCRSAFCIFCSFCLQSPCVQLTDHAILFSLVIPISPVRGPANWIIEIQTEFPTSNTFSVLLVVFCNAGGMLLCYSNILDDSQTPSIYPGSFITKLFSREMISPPALLSI